MTHPIAPAGYIPDGYVGPVNLPGTGRVVFWTGRIAIGLRYEAPTRQVGDSEAWIQGLLIDPAARRLAS
jgi:hypothetical protein